jgi:hypothetical protein
MKVTCAIDFTDLENDDGRQVESVRATCNRCGNETESFGAGAASVRRCLVLMREECLKGEANFYVAEDGENGEE